MSRSPPLLALYRLQFNAQFTLNNGAALVDYLKRVGISHYYASPLLKARPGSDHGYDIVDHSALNPEIGSDEDFSAMVERLHQAAMGLIIDIVPNHMCIGSEENFWWQDLLENGPSSVYATYFDVDWSPAQPRLHNKVLLPLLDQPFGTALEDQAICIAYSDGVFLAKLPFRALPTDPSSWRQILEPLLQRAKLQLPPEDIRLIELYSITTAIKYLPTISESEEGKLQERRREKQVIKKRMALLFSRCRLLTQLLEETLLEINGIKGKAESFDSLEEFLNAQPYRLCYWRVANEEINYRRFFDVSEFAGIKTEESAVFEAVHKLPFSWIDKKMVDGIRIDHIDGLSDPEQYLQQLQQYTGAQPYRQDSDHHGDNLFYVIAEKILLNGENLRRQWLLHGTVGYDALNDLNGLFIDRSGLKEIQAFYKSYTGNVTSKRALLYTCKKHILSGLMSSELHVLGRKLDRIARQHRSSSDFTEGGLREALSDIIACFPIYRTYMRPLYGLIDEDDRNQLRWAITQAKHFDPSLNNALLNFIEDLLLQATPQGLTAEQKQEREEFCLRFQQLTGPIMAKGVEDTAFYRYYPLLSINEVGNTPHSDPITIEAFHKKNSERLQSWPYSIITTSTHDTKRSEDMRARLNVLSELPQDWQEALLSWSEINSTHRTTSEEGEAIPDRNEEYLLYQTLVGSYPLKPMGVEAKREYIDRIQKYMVKSLKEDKAHSNWLNPDEEYESNVVSFVSAILKGDRKSNRFLASFEPFTAELAMAGMLNSLSQLLLKCTVPGVPDFYQGNEVWDFSLVDPDNRRPVDFSHLSRLFDQLLSRQDVSSDQLLRELLLDPFDGRLKLYFTHTVLSLRAKLSDLFANGEYSPISVIGQRADQLIAFERSSEGKSALIAVGRYFTSLLQENKGCLLNGNIWRGTFLIVPKTFKGKRGWEHLSKRWLEVQYHRDMLAIELSQAFEQAPFLLLESE